MALNLKDIERQFHADGFFLGMQIANADLKKETLHKALQQLHSLVDEVVDSFSAFAERNNQLPACSKGCHWCCHQPVFALSYELDLLNEFIEKHFDLATRMRIASHAAIKREKLSGLNMEHLLQSKSPCPLLDNGTCIAYAVRPVACRIYLSSNVGSCLQFYNEPEKGESIPALLHIPLRMGRMLNEGFKAALKANGLLVEEYRIEEKLLQTADFS